MHQLPIEKVEKELTTDFQLGLSTTEVTRRQKQFGKNVLETKPKKWWAKILLEQFANPLVWVLIIAVILAIIFQEKLEAIAIIIVIFINAGIGFFMELQANRSMEALTKLSSQIVSVLRNGETYRLNSKELVVGDIILLEAGDIVSADARIIQQQNLGVKEAALTGESTQISKSVESIDEDTSIADRKNSLFKGTVVSRGNAKAVITHIGKNTQLGKIATLTEDALKVATPIEKKLNDLSKKLIGLTFVLTVAIIIIGYFDGRDLYQLAKTAIALAIAAIPEGLPVVATIALAKGMLRLSKHQVIVKKLSAVETLGEVQFIFTDKTGTLTENQLSVHTLLFSFGKFGIQHDKAIKPTSTLHEIESHAAFDQLLKTSVLCNNASIGTDEDGKELRNGDPLEIALLEFGKTKGVDIEKINKDFPRVKEIPFDSDTKMMGTLHQMSDGKYLACIKGALEVLLKKSNRVMMDKEEESLQNQDFWSKKNNELAAKGERTLAFAYKIVDQPTADFFNNLTFIGCIGFLDPPRADIKAAITTCKDAGIKVIMVTGDHPETAKNIAQQVGMVNGEEAMVLTGDAIQDIDSLNASEIENLLHTNVFARVSPAQKLDIINLYQERNYTVGMTGDGINDAPALKKADIGIAMGQRGTDAAKEAAELVLEDDSFNSIVIAIRQGRGIFTNIRYFVVYLLSCNLSEIFVVLLASLFSWGTPLFPLQILFLNMVTDVFPALALGVGKTPTDAMLHPPRKQHEAIITKKHWQAIMGYSIAMTIPVLAINFVAIEYLLLDDLVSNNLMFYTLILVQLWHLFNLPHRSVSILYNEITRNKFVWGAIIICILIPIILYQFEPIRLVLNLRSLTIEHVLLIIGFSIMPNIITQILKKLKIIL